MSTYNNAGNPCFDGHCLVSMADGTTRRVMDVSKGDALMGTNGKCSTVVCVVRTVCRNGKAYLVQMNGGLRVTPYHPIRMGGKFLFPCTVGTVQEMDCAAVYSFVLDSQHTATINHVECITLGHDFHDDPVARHPYFGSARVIHDLHKMAGWHTGFIQLRDGCLHRQANGHGLVTALVQ